MEKRKLGLSAVIIAKNEAERIGRCIDALSFADEVIVVDNGSDDATVNIAKKRGAAVIEVHSENFSEIRTRALQSVKTEWVLYVDADETLTRELSTSISDALRTKSPIADAYELFRKNFYLGYPWPSGEWMLRLFKRSKISEWTGTLHESPNFTGTIRRIRGDLLHDTHRTLSEMVNKTNEWSDIEANLRLSAHHPPVTWWRILRVMVTGFFQSFIRQKGWKAGTVGWIESIYQGFSYFITYAKLWEKQQT